MKATALLKRQHREVEKVFSTALKAGNEGRRWPSVVSDRSGAPSSPHRWLTRRLLEERRP